MNGLGLSRGPRSRIWTTFGWSICRVISASLRNIRTMAASEVRCGSSRFTATAGPNLPSACRARPRYTSAMPPVAMRDVSLYRPNQDELVLRVNEARSLHRRRARPLRAAVLKGQAAADPGGPGTARGATGRPRGSDCPR